MYDIMRKYKNQDILFILEKMTMKNMTHLHAENR
jgi:hypothetical protein